jgi:hypothetical protein
MIVEPGGGTILPGRQLPMFGAWICAVDAGEVRRQRQRDDDDEDGGERAVHQNRK